ncbi:MAG: stage III sporulation protein AF [Acetivibrionales bacterium]
MVEFLKHWVLNIIALVMLIVLLEIIIPSGKTKKFVHLISGFILIIAIISPLLDLLAGDISVKDFEISTRYFIDRKEIEKKSRVLEDKHMKQITELYRKKIIEQIEQGAKQIDGIVHADGDVIINEDYKSSSFGEIKRVYLHVKLEPEEQGDRPVTEIKTEKIKIEGRGSSGKDNEDKEKMSGKEEKNNVIKEKVEDKISEALAIQKENIAVTIQ